DPVDRPGRGRLDHGGRRDADRDHRRRLGLQDRWPAEPGGLCRTADEAASRVYMSFGDYLFGVLGLAAVAIPMALAAVRLRRRLLAGWEGAPARLVEAVLAVALLTVILQLLGAFGIIYAAVLIPVVLLVGLGLWFGPWLRTESTGQAPPAPELPRAQTLLALLAAAFVAAHWATGLQDVWGRGMLTFDTLWYHGPFAARIADTGSVWGMHFIDPLYLNWFYP